MGIIKAEEILLMEQEELMNKIAELERDITGRYVIYRGEKAQVDGVQYLNVEEYLESL